jgi:hypothetical protein
MERVLPLREVEPRYESPLPADHLRAKGALLHQQFYEHQINMPGHDVYIRVNGIDASGQLPAFQILQSVVAIFCILDLRDYGNDSTRSYDDLMGKLDSVLTHMASLHNRGLANDLPFILLLSNSEFFVEQVNATPFPLTDGFSTSDGGAAIHHIVSQCRVKVKLPLTHHLLEMDETGQCKGLIDAIKLTQGRLDNAVD